MNKIIVAMMMIACTFSVHAIENKFIGSWKLSSGEYLDSEEKLIHYKDLKMSSIKVISETHFSFVSMSGNKFWSAGAGIYRFTESEYIESPIHTSYGVTLSKEYIFTYKIEDDIWYNSRWSNGKRVEYEIWRKLP